jgi:RNA polymerase sigma-70 factor (ECF subfamily)
MRVARSANEIEGLASRMAALEEQSYVDFADIFGPRLKTFFLRRGLSPADAEDLSVSCVTDIALKITKYQSIGEGSFGAWVFTLARHSLADWWRARQETIPLSDQLEAMKPSDEPETESEVAVAVREALEQLSETDRALVRLRNFGAEHSYAEIGERLGLRSETARVRHFRALKRLKALLEVDVRLSRFLKSQTTTQ